MSVDSSGIISTHPSYLALSLDKVQCCVCIINAEYSFFTSVLTLQHYFIVHFLNARKNILTSPNLIQQEMYLLSNSFLE